jgi:hypothetical protein
MPALTDKKLFVYFSPESAVQSPSYGGIPFPVNATNYTAVRYPVETLEAISPSKMKAMRNLSYGSIVDSLGGGVEFEVEVEPA